jgi:hypothetical protein
MQNLKRILAVIVMVISALVLVLNVSFVQPEAELLFSA